MCLYIVHANSPYNFHATTLSSTVPSARMHGTATRQGFRYLHVPVSIFVPSASTASSTCSICTPEYVIMPRLYRHNPMTWMVFFKRSASQTSRSW